MKALQWQGVNKLAVGEVPDPEIRNAGDIIVKVNRTVTCGSDLHLLGGYIPFMEKGDVLGHEFVGEVVETGPDVRNHQVGDQVVVSSFIACGKCWFCEQRLFSLCDNGNTNPAITETLWGQAPGGCFGYSHAMGGNPGSHAQWWAGPGRVYRGDRDGGAHSWPAVPLRPGQAAASPADRPAGGGPRRDSRLP
ncbi:hypothetical protein Ato02nite_054360 [Paractinoplanes toevensis]|uniref:Alcohol dehydrogenase-like N-terminal domain-containing protein n=1 Tax=Paractinoplanes toevensis TaxID=571911 RepID=A0A919TDW6_9ACTN|nr:hypothetical protein Ato02nite_054360 [Actinoplanes toevensis]